MEDKKIIIEAPDEFGLPTDDELEAEERAEFEKRLADKKSQRDASVKKAKAEKELKAKAEEVLNKVGENPTFETLFDELVPTSGPSTSLGGELIRAVNRLEYRYFNDGDRFFEGYGLETCGSPAAFICDNVEKFGKASDNDIDMIIRDTAENNLNEDDYEEFIENLKARIVNLVTKEHPELLATPLGEKDIHSWCNDPEEYWEDYIPKYEYQLSVSNDSILGKFLEKEVIDSFDVKEWVENNLLYDFDNAEVDTPWGHSDDEYTVINLTQDEYEQLKNWDNSGNIWEDYESELEDQYGDPDDYNDDEENESFKKATQSSKSKSIEIKEDYNDFDTKAFENAYQNGDIYCQIADLNGEDFLIVDGWEDVAKIQKLLNPSFEQEDKYDTSVIDKFMPWGFSDSYTTCDECGKVIETEPDSYSWTPDFFVGDGFIVCGDCVRANPSEYIEHLINNPDVANTILNGQELQNEGFEKLDGDYENGWYDRADSPKEILSNLLEKHPNGEFIFSISGQEQFRTNFEVYGRGLEEEEEPVDEGIVGGKQVEVTRDVCRDLENKLYILLNENDIYPEDGTFDPSNNRLADLQLTLIIDGDWKHDHLFTEQLVEEFCKKNGLIIVRHDEEGIGESDSDSYKAEHKWFIDYDDGEGEKRLNAFRNVFN